MWWLLLLIFMNLGTTIYYTLYFILNYNRIKTKLYIEGINFNSIKTLLTLSFEWAFLIITLIFWYFYVL